jgi:hypothetical protein
VTRHQHGCNVSSESILFLCWSQTILSGLYSDFDYRNSTDNLVHLETKGAESDDLNVRCSEVQVVISVYSWS